MGRLAGFKYREVVRRLRVFGFAFDRQGPGSHEVWRHAVTGRKVTVPHHSRGFAEGTVVADFDEEGNIVGIDIDHASHKLDLNTLETVSLPVVTKAD